MDIAVKQRILGGVVLVAGAILFLPMLLEGAGVRALQPPAPPAPPATPTTEQLAPALQHEAQALEQGISASHGEPTFYPVQPPQLTDTAPTQAVEEQFRLVEPAAAKVPPVVPASAPAPAAVVAPQPDAAALAASKAAADRHAAQLKAEQARLEETARQAAQAKSAAEKKAAEQKLAEQQKLLADKKAAEARRLADERAKAAKTAADARAKAEAQARADKDKAARLAAEKKAAADKTATQAAAVAAQPAEKSAATPDPALPQAWVVQVASLSAKDKAQALVDKLRAKGYRAALGGGEGAWRVSIGPELDKSVVQSIKARVAADPALKLSGWVQAYRP